MSDHDHYLHSKTVQLGMVFDKMPVNALIEAKYKRVYALVYAAIYMSVSVQFRVE